MEIKPGKYLHFKGHLVEVIGIGRHSETLEEFVVYKHDNEEFGRGSLWIRPKTMFLETVKIDGKEVPRFKFINKKIDRKLYK
ncbi:DUF1653 domain-containing protein [Candidatus Woesearchaeota archaeon]|nr:DUF1653 domain-containing protein [Candidatus Woesearchaeota archaeon]